MDKNRTGDSFVKPFCTICLEENKELIIGDGYLLKLYQELISEVFLSPFHVFFVNNNLTFAVTSYIEWPIG